MFIEQADFNTSIFNEILSILTRNDGVTLDDLIGTAISEMTGFLSSRYKTDVIFSQTGSKRNKTLIMLCKDITLYHLHSKGNPNQIPDIRVKRYDDAKRTLREIRKGDFNIPDLPVIDTDETVQVKYGFNTKRENHY